MKLDARRDENLIEISRSSAQGVDLYNCRHDRWWTGNGYDPKREIDG